VIGDTNGRAPGSRCCRLREARVSVQSNVIDQPFWTAHPFLVSHTRRAHQRYGPPTESKWSTDAYMHWRRNGRHLRQPSHRRCWQQIRVAVASCLGHRSPIPASIQKHQISRRSHLNFPMAGYATALELDPRHVDQPFGDALCGACTSNLIQIISPTWKQTTLGSSSRGIDRGTFTLSRSQLRPLCATKLSSQFG
jgi:hypothetical protein